ncbi:hypothetical protein M407DRAFT_30948 [Tulasnella calospora MUT 4182]|uniref:Methionyl/Leucyl tRNA synthetase domain-containing protein n=1 Tax=Tulasnella calospora MUT 4182 TaxID=1051891 RepID=A0A0C3Q7C8_9AGAM|nr:hypothetical protein M407DRAFT_30948 [Tulasnella calospora MUT 4182]
MNPRVDSNTVIPVVLPSAVFGNVLHSNPVQTEPLQRLEKVLQSVRLMLRNGIKPTFRFSGCLRSPSLAATTTSPRATPKWKTYSTTAGPSSVPTPTKPYYVTTPIFYVNSARKAYRIHPFSNLRYLPSSPARRPPLLRCPRRRTSSNARLKDPNREVYFCTGTDEHGLKIQGAAEAKGVPPKPFCDGISTRFEDLAKAAGLSHSRFIRTTEPVHYKAVEHLWRELLARGWIYKGSHSRRYSVSDEAEPVTINNNVSCTG